MAAMIRFIEACLLAAMGSFMVALSLSSGYWQYLNPKYSWLTLVAGGCVMALGFAALLDGHRRRKGTELAGLAIFLGLAVASQMLPGMLVDSGPTMPRRGGLSFSGGFGGDHSDGFDADFGGGYGPGFGGGYEDDFDSEPVEAYAGQEYVRINVAELIAGESGGWVREGDLFAVQGGLARTPELDRAGLVAVTRLFISCCFADAAGVVALVRVDDPESFTPGTWVRVLGRVVPIPAVEDTRISIFGALTAIRSERFALLANSVDTQDFTGIPYLFEIRSRSPFAY
ncbi:hypothetical protein GKC30_10085 [Pseudodesulfovibrio sp. F-1]|uniref:TIGR03943 family protein n=1 Tax=Pseudodesulfovibrio alkaliphilus TaxID=2661613 RepID=A0A7K1KPG9_9BACT|nr:hypothetical protein [Pseudodesulfovibrio alkaliphilus]MUM77983.1 hypothetical protein [Pseudodesulfovibrio alkaliphilus]